MEENYESRGYLLDDYRLFHLSEPQKEQIPYHYHEFCKVFLLCSGSGDYAVEGQHYTLQPGDIVLVGSHCVHRPEFAGDAPYERIIIYISPEFLRRESREDCDLKGVFSGEGSHVLRLEEGRRRRLFQLAERLEQELSGEDFGRVILSNGLLLRLLVEMGRERRGGVLRPVPASSPNMRIRDILRYIDGHLTEDITIDSLSERFFISKYHMMRLFRKETGQSIHGYLSDRRLLYARERMKEGMSATESCFRCGFGSYSAFVRAYNKRFGTTPTGRSNQLDETYE